MQRVGLTAFLNQKFLYYLAWLAALSSMLGSLFFSEVLQWPPCNLCWWQRIFMYPLVFLIPIGAIQRDKKLPLYILPLSISGAVIATLHYLLQQHIISTVQTCTGAVACETQYLSLFGFITIPLLSLLSFLFISVCMFFAFVQNKGVE